MEWGEKALSYFITQRMYGGKKRFPFCKTENTAKKRGGESDFPEKNFLCSLICFLF